MRLLNRLHILLIAAVFLFSGAAGALWWQDQQAALRADAGAGAVPAATAAAQAIFSYDYRSFDGSVSNGTAFTTGDFTTEYEQTTATLREAVLSEQAVVRASISAAGVVHSEPDRVEVLLYVNQIRSNVNIEGEKVDQNRVVLTMVRTPDGWKVSAAAAI